MLDYLSERVPTATMHLKSTRLLFINFSSHTTALTSLFVWAMTHGHLSNGLLGNQRTNNINNFNTWSPQLLLHSCQSAVHTHDQVNQLNQEAAARERDSSLCMIIELSESPKTRVGCVCHAAQIFNLFS